MKPILSICIPTYNRSYYLEKAIRSILIQQPYIEGKVEIVVSDNCSCDNTESMVKELSSQYKNIVYYRNEYNVGAINYSMALERGRGVYRKLSNDTVFYNHRSLSDMVYTIEQCMGEKPVIIWKIYHRIGKDYVKTTSFEKIMRTISYLSTWISLYGIWEDEAKDVVEDCLRAKCNYQKRFRELDPRDIVAQRRFPIVDIAVDTFWHLRHMQKEFEKRKKAVIVDSGFNWSGDEAPKNYGKGVLKWFFYDYYMDILREFCANGFISKECLCDLERDLGFSFFVKYMVDFEFPSSNIEYDPEDTLVQDVLDEYKDKEYYNELFEYYQFCRKEKMKAIGIQ